MGQIEPFVGEKYPEDNYTWELGPIDLQNFRYLGPRNSVYVCPGYNRAHGWVSGFRYGNSTLDVRFGSYGYNLYGAGALDDGTKFGLAGYVDPLTLDGPNIKIIPLRENQVGGRAK